jgi:hypothetical protein
MRKLPARLQNTAGKVPVAGRHVVIVEDIVDTGRTLQRLREHVTAAGAASVAVAALLDKQEKRVVQVEVEYTGFVCPDEFVVGCGMHHCCQHELKERQGLRDVPLLCLPSRRLVVHFCFAPSTVDRVLALDGCECH